MAHPEISLTVELGKAIRKRRKELGMTQEELAEKIGVGHQALSRIENGIMAPKMDRLPLIAENLKCSVAELFYENHHNLTNYATRIADLLTGLSKEKSEFVYQHLAGLVFLLKLDK